MSIDRHNYEEMFILYWDDELSAAQKQAVDEFVAANPDLQEEFTLLGSSRFSAEEKITFPSKELLFQNESVINQNNYEEFILSYIDGEVNQQERAEIEKFLKSNPEIQTELVLFQSARLHPDTHVVFPDKSVLYRREEKTFRMVWIRIAAAAVVLLIAGVFTFNLLNNGSAVEDEPKFAVQQKDSQPEVTPSSKELVSTDNESASSPGNEKDAAALASTTIASKEATKEMHRVKSNVESNSVNDVVNVHQSTTDATNESIDRPIVTPVDYIAQKEDVDANINFAKGDVTSRTSPTFNDIEAPESVKDNGGVKGLLRKATRVFERRTNIKATTDDDKLLVGAFAVSLK